MERLISILGTFLAQPVRLKDAVILSIATVIFTMNPYYLNNEINLLELGLYLPGINAIHHGLVPFKDFIHLRGPLEIYAPACLMNIFGMRMEVLSAYFFFGNVLCLIFVVLIASELIRSRFMLYLMIPPIIARTFPRMCYMIWGGMRYAMGLIAIYCLIKFLKKKHPLWMIATGVAAALASLISVEMGIFVVAAVVVCLIAAGLTRLMSMQECRKSALCFFASSAIVVAPWILYSLQQNAFMPWMDTMWTVITRLHVVINEHLLSVYPSNFPEAFRAMINPGSINFRHMTPSYMYLFLLGYLIWRWKKGMSTTLDLALLSLGVYGFFMYNTSFRGIWAAQFEMALMPEKILYFFLVETALLWMWGKKNLWPVWAKAISCLVVMAIFLFSVGYSLSHFSKRFWVFQYSSKVLSRKNTNSLKYQYKDRKYAKLDIERAKGIWVPVEQQKELTQIDQFIKEHTTADDAVLMFPEAGIYNFLFDRPFVGRFPIVTFSWFNDHWFDEYMGSLKSSKAKYVIAQKKMPDDWYVGYMWNPSTKAKYTELLAYIDENYKPVSETQFNMIYARK